VADAGSMPAYESYLQFMAGLSYAGFSPGPQRVDHRQMLVLLQHSIHVRQVVSLEARRRNK